MAHLKIVFTACKVECGSAYNFIDHLFVAGSEQGVIPLA
jgi:hypothetical protein